VLSLALVLVTATLDRTIRVPNDITAKYGLDVLAVVPNMRR
jgi:capsular polysaccharide biosynthesis protein